jgi:hypothetical protein
VVARLAISVEGSSALSLAERAREPLAALLDLAARVRPVDLGFEGLVGHRHE